MGALKGLGWRSADPRHRRPFSGRHPCPHRASATHVGSPCRLWCEPVSQAGWMEERSRKGSPHSTTVGTRTSPSPDASGAAAAPVAESVAMDGVRAAHESEQNQLLHALPIEDYSAILPHLTAVRLILKEPLMEADVPIRDVYFPREGVVSFISEQQEHG